MIKLTGTVFNSKKQALGGGYETIPFAQVYISDELGYMTPKKLVTTTLENGKFELSLPSTFANGIPIPLIDGKYLTAKAGSKRVIVPLSGKSNYDLDLKDTSFYSSEEVTVTGKRPPVEEPKKWNPFLIVGIVALVATTGYLIYEKYKK